MILARLTAAALVAASLAPIAAAKTYVEVETATLRALDKITGRSTDINIEVGEPIVFGSLQVELKSCYQTPPEEAPESAAFLIVKSTQPVAVETMTTAVSATEVDTVAEDNPQIFSGWMFASSPGLSALEHPVYDIWVIQCAELVEAPADYFEQLEEDAGNAAQDPNDPLDPDEIFELR